MIKRRALLFFALIVVTAFLASRLMTYSDNVDGSNSLTNDAPIGSSPILEVESSSTEQVDLGPLLPASADACLTPEQLETHPMFAADNARLDSVAITGPTMASYRGLSSAQLMDLAVQGDSAAMAVMGAVSLMRSRKLAEDNAVPYLLFEEMNLHTYWSPSTQDPEVLEHLEAAHDWFYKAALHGRLLALYYVGEMRGLIEGGPVGLGWIDKEEYDALKGRKKSAIMSSTIYNALVFEIAPQLRDGPSGIIYDLLPRDERQASILAALARQFDQDRIDAKLPPIKITESTAPSTEEIRAMLCESYLDLESYLEN